MGWSLSLPEPRCLSTDLSSQLYVPSFLRKAHFWFGHNALLHGNNRGKMRKIVWQSVRSPVRETFLYVVHSTELWLLELLVQS